MMNRKLRKLIRHPKAFFKDSRLVLTIRRIMKLGFPLIKVGANWKNTTAPVAIMLGFLPWKRKDAASYLHEFRTLFAESNAPIEAYADKILAYSPLCIIIWGYNERYDVTAFSARHAIPVYRMEDGFLRSVTLGSAHTRPYSLVLDKSSLYFNAEEQSDLEKLLAAYDFNQSPELLQRAEQLIAFQKEFGISKYSLPAGKGSNLTKLVPRKRCILVIGQVENDKSILYGRGENWTCTRLIQLACEENPDCEILYRPHPDVTHGMRTDNVRLGSLPSRCRIVDRDEPLAELFALVERVYVITSLSGFEALLHGLPVTTVGLPFYAGWGLTDDRFPDHQRNRTLTLAELYAAAYLLYPRYILNLQNSLDGCQKTLFKLCEEKNGIKLLGTNWENGRKPVALLYGVGPQASQLLTESLAGYRVARLREKDMDLIRICRTMKVRTLFVGTMPLSEEILRQARQEHIELVAVTRGLDCTGTAPSTGCPESLVLEPFPQEIPEAFGQNFDRLTEILGEFPVAEYTGQIASMKMLLPLNRLIARSLDQLANSKPSQGIIPLRTGQGERILVLAKSADDAHTQGSLARQEHPDGELFIILEDKGPPTHTLPPGWHVLPDTALQRTLDFVDCVYTKDSLYALEALRCDLPVIVSGKPFYAGWGFTDDRQPIERPRKLSREAFFYAVFVLYPRYISSPKNSLTGFFSTSLKKSFKQLGRKLDEQSFGITIDKANEVKPAKDVQLKALIKDLGKLCQTPGWYMVMICLLWSFGKKNEQAQLLNWAETQLPADVLPVLLQLLAQTEQDINIRWRLVRSYARAGRSKEARLLLDELQGRIPENTNEKKPVCSPETAFQLARIHKENHDAEQSRQQYLLALAGGRTSLATLEELADILAECMDFESSAALDRLLYSLAVQKKSAALASRSLVGLTVSNARAGNREEALLWLALLSSRSMNEAIRAADVTQTFWVRQFPGINIYACIQAWAKDTGQLEKRVKIRMFASEFDEAIHLMDSHIQEVSDSIQLSLLYARIRFFLGEYDEAEHSYAWIVRRFGLSPSTCYHYLYFCLHTGRYDKLGELLDRCRRMNLANKAYFLASLKLHQRDIGGSFPALCDLDSHREMQHLLGDKCVRSLDEVHEGERLLVIACSGVGDEIGNAIFYQRIAERCCGQTTFTCDPRLYSFFARSLPHILLEPVCRLRHLNDMASSPGEYADLPSSAFVSMFDNHGYALFKKADKVILDFDAVRSVVKGYEDFSGLARMKADENLVRQYQAQLPDDGKLNVGLCWRSALKRYSRARNYCDIEEFAPLLQRNDVRFVILQYDGCTPHESAWLEKEFPGKTISFEYLDMFRDLDGLAAAIAALDLVISPAVNIRQFSGCLGIPTSFLVSGASVEWRKAEQDDHDVIYPHTVHRRIEKSEDMITYLQQDIDNALKRKGADSVRLLPKNDHASSHSLTPLPARCTKGDCPCC